MSRCLYACYDSHYSKLLRSIVSWHWAPIFDTIETMAASVGSAVRENITEETIRNTAPPAEERLFMRAIHGFSG